MLSDGSGTISESVFECQVQMRERDVIAKEKHNFLRSAPLKHTLVSCYTERLSDSRPAFSEGHNVLCRMHKGF